MKNSYIYPNTLKTKEEKNPYISDFTNSLSKYFNFLNKDKPTNSGIIDLFKYVSKLDIIFFHWIEDVPDKKGGIAQTFAFYILIIIIKLRRIKIFYTLHNKESHYSTNKFLKKLVKKTILRHSDYIVCHASDGLKLVNNNQKNKIKYIPHPFKKFNVQDNLDEEKYDILIWGAIRPYKGIDEYLKYLISNKLRNKYKTLIIGKIFPKEYEDELMKYNSDKVQIENKYIDDLTLNSLIAKSKITLFTYNEKSVLSSGALVYSLSQGAMIIGPNIGAFQDLYSEELIDVFENYDDLIKKIDSHLKVGNNYSDKIIKFVDLNTWDNYGEKIAKWIAEK